MLGPRTKGCQQHSVHEREHLVDEPRHMRPRTGDEPRYVQVMSLGLCQQTQCTAPEYTSVATLPCTFAWPGVAGYANGRARCGWGCGNNHFTGMCCGTEAGSYLRLIDSCIIQLKAQGTSRTCNESKEEEEEEEEEEEGYAKCMARCGWGWGDVRGQGSRWPRS